MHQPPPPLAQFRPNAPPEAWSLIEKALEKDPLDRYQSMREIAVDLRRMLRRKPDDAVKPMPRRSIVGWPLLAATAVVLIAAAGLGVWLHSQLTEWVNPLSEAKLTRLTDWEGSELDAAISPDGKFAAFLADRDGAFDAWVTQIGSGAFTNLTNGELPELLHAQASSVGFSADGTRVWLRHTGNVVSIPTMGGTPKPFLHRRFLPAPSPRGDLIVSSEAAPQKGEPIWISASDGGTARMIFRYKGPGHTHYATWSRDGLFIYFAEGLPSNRILRVPVSGGDAEPVTPRYARVGYPSMLDNRVLIYIADDETGSHLWAMDVERKQPHRLNVGVEQYLSISASADGRRLVAAVANPSAGLWSVPITGGLVDESAVSRYNAPSVHAFAPRLGSAYLLYLSSTGNATGLWKASGGRALELWKPDQSRLTDPAAISPDGRRIAFIAYKQNRGSLYTVTSDGADPQPLAAALDASGSCSWSPDGKWIAVAGDQGAGVKLYKVPTGGGAPVVLVDRPAYNPLWSPDGGLILYEDAPGGTGRLIRAVTSDARELPEPKIATRSGGDLFRFLPGGRQAVFLLGQFRRQNFWEVDLATGQKRQLTNLKPGYFVKGFDITPDGRRIVFDRIRENSDIVLIERGG
jgi:Tol biopolymer transport system component